MGKSTLRSNLSDWLARRDQAEHGVQNANLHPYKQQTDYDIVKIGNDIVVEPIAENFD